MRVRRRRLCRQVGQGDPYRLIATPTAGLVNTVGGKELAGGGTRQLTQPLPGSACRGGCPRAGAALQPVPQPDRGGALLERTGPVVKQAGIHHRDALGQRWGWGVLCHGRLLRQVHPSEPDRARVQTPPIERSAKDTGPCKPPPSQRKQRRAAGAAHGGLSDDRRPGVDEIAVTPLDGTWPRPSCSMPSVLVAGVHGSRTHRAVPSTPPLVLKSRSRRPMTSNPWDFTLGRQRIRQAPQGHVHTRCARHRAPHGPDIGRAESPRQGSPWAAIARPLAFSLKSGSSGHRPGCPARSELPLRQVWVVSAKPMASATRSQLWSSTPSSRRR